MQKNKTLKQTIKDILEFANVPKKIARWSVGLITKKEFEHPPFAVFNERPVEYRFVFEAISNFYPKTLLDIGTGVTALPHLVANCGVRVTAIDNIKDYWPAGMFNRHFYVINDDITKPRLKEKFDMVTCISTLEHIEAYDDAVRSMFSLLNPGGHLVLTFPYTEKKFIDNVYALEGTNAGARPFKTHSYARETIERWMHDNGAAIIAQEYWQFFTGECWTLGERLALPKQATKDELHQISCVLLKKN